MTLRNNRFLMVKDMQTLLIKLSVCMLLLFGYHLLTTIPSFAEEGGVQNFLNQLFSVVKPEEPIVQWAQDNLSQSGVLKEGRDGFVYLKVDDGYINQLFPMISNPGYVKPAYFRRPDAPGAHISVMYVDERNRTGDIAELGKSYSFKITRLAFVPPRTRKYIVLEIDCPELESLRKKYGLSPLLKGHDFHITIAKKQFRQR